MATSEALGGGGPVPHTSVSTPASVAAPRRTLPAASGSGSSKAGGRRKIGVMGQYAFLAVLSLLVLGPLFLTVIQALSPPFRYVSAGRPLHPVEVAWKHRTWWSGGILSAVVRSVAVAGLFAWLQRAASARRWNRRTLLEPAYLVAVVGGTIVLGLATGPAFGSLSKADGNSAFWIVSAMVLVALTQVWGFYTGAGRRPLVVALSALLTGVGIVGFAVLFAGPDVWTTSWSKFDLGAAMGRSLIMAVLITVLQVSTAVASAYAFVFLHFPFKRVFFALFMATLLLPLEVTVIGNIATMRQLGWTNTMQGLVLPFGAYALGTFLIRQGFRGLPPDIRDATRVDGYGHFAFLTKFAVPLTRPVIASFTVLSALSAWNQYLWPRTVISKNSFNTLQIQLRAVAGSQVANANQAIAAALVAAVPVVILLVAFQRQIIRGLTAGAVK